MCAAAAAAGLPRAPRQAIVSVLTVCVLIRCVLIVSIEIVSVLIISIKTAGTGMISVLTIGGVGPARGPNKNGAPTQIFFCPAVLLLHRTIPAHTAGIAPTALPRHDAPMKVEIGDATLYLGDCLEVLPLLPRVDAVITDPPYGIDIAAKGTIGKSNKAVAKDYGKSDWDKAPPSEELINAMRAVSEWQAFFGGNYFVLPPTSCWLVWDKLNTGNFADCELAWTNWPKTVRRIQWRWNGMIRQGNEERCHPTQKPLEVMKWVIDLCPQADTILDPFMGSGTTGVAALQLGRKFIGIEREPKYFDIACRRIEQAVAQGRLFDAPAPRPAEQAALI